ncbi:phosphatase PAP2 family protein [Caulobacter segnis]|uniref:acid phosphatase n=1 Tax=Caulobacter segnis TaxID=88688 RepID=UPI00240F39B3|nr:phosphatase PAP2 family protein [Caulobacter segnis]MDG2521047.1 phosphatase PAP2 family protein [Caulobacter segnis]
MRFVLAAALLLTAGTAVAAPAKEEPKGYLPTPLDTTIIVPPAPVAGTTRYEADRTIFLSTRSLKDGPRWALALKDDHYEGLMGAFACAVGFTPDEKTTPTLVKIMHRIEPDLDAAVRAAKTLYQRQRPFLIDEGEICLPKTDALKKSPDYPSGHGTLGWTASLILAEAAPERASQILQRGRAFGESRIVCGVHNASAIEAARITGSALVARLHGETAFRKDMDAARAEVAKARATTPAPDAAACETEAALIAKPPF